VKLDLEPEIRVAKANIPRRPLPGAGSSCGIWKNGQNEEHNE
jgi:hypothetical protein